MIKKHAIRFAVGALGGLMAVGIVFAAVPHNYNKDAGILEEAGQTDDDGKKQIALSNCTVTISQDSYESDGTEKKPEVTVKNGNEVIPSSEYTTAYFDNVNVGTATVTITANYDSSVVRGSVTKTFTITEKVQIALSDCTVTISQDSYESDGTEKKPEVTVKRGDEVIPPSEYTAVYSDNVDAGTATVTVTANDDSSAVRGSITKTFTNSFEWSISDDGKLIVTGSCSGKLYTEEGHDVVYPWHEYKYQIKSVYIDVTGLTDMRYMFAYCKNLSSVDVSSFDVSYKSAYMSGMFKDCYNLTEIIIDSDMSGWWELCEEIGGNLFDGCGAVDVTFK